MRYLRVFGLLALLGGVCLIPLHPAQAQHVSVGIGIGLGPAYAPSAVVAAPPACAYGYYPYYPYACAPYGYYGPGWFVNGVFIGAGPWYHGYWGHPYWGRPGFYAHPGSYGRGPVVHGFAAPHPRAVSLDGRGEFHGGAGFHGGGGIHGGRR